nr:unnamed protein product [Spirometra erinaceieuropaei]
MNPGFLATKRSATENIMECKAEPFSGGPGDFLDIPAAEQEITVGSNEPATSNVSSSIVQNVVSLPSEGVFQTVSHPVVRMATPGAIRAPRVIMVQRTGQPVGSTTPGAPTAQGIRAVKIITVPGQGVGGKALKAAVIPMHMLQRGVKVLTSTGHQTIGPGGAVISTGGVQQTAGMPRFLALRPAGQIGAAPGGNITVLGSSGAPIRPGTLILSGPPGAGMATRVGPSFALPPTAVSGAGAAGEDIENAMLSGGPEAGFLAGQAPAPQGGFFELSANHPHAQFAHPGSPSGRDSDTEQDHVATGLKTNGLRRYARCVCNKVKEKGITSYSEVADELVHEYAAEHPMIPSEQLHYIQKNIRRRVYDALNVLMALNVLQKEKKEIRWVGLPINMIEECRRLEEEREKRQISLRNKTAEIQELILQLIAFKNLVVRNRINERYKRQRQAQREAAALSTASGAADTEHHTDVGGATGKPSTTMEMTVAALTPQKLDNIPLPFMIVSTNRKAVIDCNISSDKLEYLFNFDQAFEIRDEVDTLKRMGLTLRLGSAQCTQEEYNQCLELIPPSLRFYVEAIYERRQAIVPDFEALHQQRRLFIEARIAEAAAAGTASDLSHPGDDSQARSDHLGSGTQSRRLQSGSPSANGGHFGFFDSGVNDDSSVRQIQIQRGVPTDLVPGDTQHYARTAAARGFVVPGGPDGLLRHRGTPSAPSQFRSQAGSIHRQAVKMTVEGSAGAGTGGVLGDAENVSATAAISGDLRGGPRHMRMGRGLLDEEDDAPEDDEDMDMGDDDDDEDEDEDDDDMEDVQDVLKHSP